ncbi:MAG: helix-turn-helix domain-containing protein, partial [Butyricicoccus sp.]|nr:helix-turn-helix domain-containing protein [Butyricicoccus sp.]
HRTDCSQLYVVNRLAQLNMDLSSFFVLRLHISPLEDDALSEAELSDALEQSQEILTDCLSAYSQYYIARGTQDCYCVVCAAPEEPIAALCKEAVDIVCSLPRFTLSIGISNHRNDPTILADASDEASQAMQFTNFVPDQPVVQFDELHSFPTQSMDAIYDRLRELKSMIDSRSSSEVMRLLDELFLFLRTNKLPPDTVRSTCVYVHQFSMDLQFPQSAEGGINVLKRILETTSISEMEEHTRKFAEQMLDLSQSNSDNVDTLIRSVKSYIDTHYSEALSLERLAQQFYLSPSYLSRIFKRETSINLSTHLQNVRIEAAKMLLRTTDLRSYEVAERVGISDPVYFSRIFKKLTGFKPKDYRHSQEQ